MDQAQELDEASARSMIGQMVELEERIEATERILAEIRCAFRVKLKEQKELRDEMNAKRRELLDRARGLPYTPVLQMGGNSL